MSVEQPAIEMNHDWLRVGSEINARPFVDHYVDHWVFNMDGTVARRGTWKIYDWSPQQVASYHRRARLARLLTPLSITGVDQRLRDSRWPVVRRLGAACCPPVPRRCVVPNISVLPPEGVRWPRLV